MSSIDWLTLPAQLPSESSRRDALSHQNSLTKPLGSLGKLEDIAVAFAGYQCTVYPSLTRVGIRVYAGDHGICAQNVSAYPQVVTAQMIDNFCQGGACISVLSKQLDADFAVVNMGTAHEFKENKHALNRAIAAGTRDFSVEPAMTQDQCSQAINSGKNTLPNCDLFIGGEMGIGNTSSASAIYSVLLDLPAEASVGKGTGVEGDALAHKVAVIKKALSFHNCDKDDPFSVLTSLGGFEIAALVGAYIGAAQAGIPILIDGFICTAAAMLAASINPSTLPWMMVSHCSAEAAHHYALNDFFKQKPILDLGLRLGEGSGAALCVPIIKSALDIHNQMASFDEAGVSKK